MKFTVCVPFVLWVLLVFPAGSSGQTTCEPDGQIQFLCGPISPEDLVAIPDSPWVLVSGMEDDGYLYSVDTRDLNSPAIYPIAASVPRHDRTMFGACPGPSTTRFRPHGLSLRSGSGRIHRLYVVRHGNRESIEVFQVDATKTRPRLTWVGCVIAPEGVGLNSVAALPDDGFAATKLFPTDW